MKVSKKVAIVAATTAVAMAGAGVGYAYFSGGSGSGTGTASTSSISSTALSVSAHLASGVTVPLDGTAVKVYFDVTNGNAYSLHWTSTGLTAAPTDTTNCPGSSFKVTGPATPVAGTAAPGPNANVDSGWTVKFVDSSSDNQDSCVTGGVTFTPSVSST